MHNPEILTLNWPGMQPSQRPEEARVPKENGKDTSEDLNIFFSKIIDDVYETTNSLFIRQMLWDSICADISAVIQEAKLSAGPLSHLDVYAICIQQNWDI